MRHNDCRAGWGSHCVTWCTQDICHLQALQCVIKHRTYEASTHRPQRGSASFSVHLYVCTWISGLDRLGNQVHFALQRLCKLPVHRTVRGRPSAELPDDCCQVCLRGTGREKGSGLGHEGQMAPGFCRTSLALTLNHVDQGLLILLSHVHTSPVPFPLGDPST